MGLFSSEYVHSVATTTSRLIDTQNIVSSVKAAVVSTTFDGTDMVDQVLENSITSLATRHSQVYNYGKTKYMYGLPSGEIYTNNQGGPELQAIVDALTGGVGLLEYRRFGAANGIHMGWMRIIQQYNYNTQTNELVGLSNPVTKMKAYLEDMVLELPSNWATLYEPFQKEIWGIPANSGYLPSRALNVGSLAELYYKPTAAVVNPGISEARIAVTYQEHGGSRYYFSEEEAQYTTKKIYFNIGLPSSQLDFFQVMYTVNGKPHYWMYEKGTGTYPQLDNLYTDAANVVGDFYPNIYFRLNDANIAANTSSQQYLQSKKLARKLNLDYDQLSEAVHQNPGIGDVDSAFITFAVPGDTTDPVELEYLYEFFDRAYAADNPSNNWGGINSGSGILGDYFSRLSLRSSQNTGGTSQAFVIKDGAFKMVLNNDGILKVRRPGNIGAVGTVTKISGNLSYQTTGTNYNDGNYSTYVETATVPYRGYRKQVNPYFYDEIQVLNLRMRYYVFGDYQTTLGDNSGEVILVPVDRQIVGAMSFTKREVLLAKSLHFVFNSHVVQKVKWYQQGWFADLLQIVGIVLTVISFGADGGFFATLGTTLATQGVIAALVLIAQQILIGVALRIAFQLFVKVVGIDLAFLAAIVAAAYGAWDMLKSSSTQLTITAKEMLSLANGLMRGATDELQSMFDDLKTDFDTFLNDSKAKEKLLDTARDLLEPTSPLAPLIVFGESPSDYYKRTVHSGNIGTLLLDDTHYFVDRSLQLPSFNSTIEGFST